MKKRALSLLMAVIMVVSLLPTAAWAAAMSVSDFFSGFPVSANPGTGTTQWKTTTLDGETVLTSGNARKSYSTSTLKLTFTADTHASFQYKISTEKGLKK